MRVPSSPADPRRLAAFWFGIQLVWGAILGVSLQARLVEIGRAHGGVIGHFTSVAATGAALAAIAQLVTGVWSDRLRADGVDRRLFYRIGTVLAVPSIWVFYTTDDLRTFALAFFALQIAMNVATGPYSAAIPDYIPADRAARASSWMSTMQFAGNALGLVIAGTINDDRWIALAVAAALAISYAVTAGYAKTLRPLPAVAEPIRLDAPFRTLLASRAFVNLGFYTLLGFLFFFVQQSLSIPDVRTATAMLFLTFTLCGVAGAAIVARPADRLDKRVVISVACAAILVALGALAATSSYPLALIAAAVAGVAWGAYFTADWALACAILSPGALAGGMGVWNLASVVPQVVAPLLTGPLVLWANDYQRGLGPRFAIVLVIVEFAVGTAWLWRLPRAFALTRSDAPAPESGYRLPGPSPRADSSA